MSFLDSLSTKAHDELKNLAAQHPTFESFRQDMERLAEVMWHNSRRQAEQDISQAGQEVVADAEKDLRPQSSIVGDTRSADSLPQRESTGNTSPDSTPDNTPQSAPAEPASPVSEGGYPTSNVDVSQPAVGQPGTPSQPVPDPQTVPAESKPAS